MSDNQASILGSSSLYKISDQAKRYSLRDYGFQETKNGNFIYERNLSFKASHQVMPKLKVSINKNFTELKLSTLAKKGLKKLDLYKNPQMEEERQVAEYILEDLVKVGILDVVG